MMQPFCGTLADIASIENLLMAWKEFVQGKRGKRDVQEFSFRLMDHLLTLHRDLVRGTYRHGGYHEFRIADPKPRVIHKASVRDWLVHHAIYRVLYPFFDRVFIADSFSCRVSKGTHHAMDRFRAMFRQVSRNNTRTCWVLKCDVRKFFASVDHAVLRDMLGARIACRGIQSLLGDVIGSFRTIERPGVGLPLGNLTSQLFANIYLNEFDQFMKRALRVKHYLRYTDDCAVLSPDREFLVSLLPRMEEFLRKWLRLSLHPEKVFLATIASGVDFLGWAHFSDHRVFRRATKRRMFARLRASPTPATLNSYLGLLRHGNAAKLRASAVREYLLHTDSSPGAGIDIHTCGV